MNKIVVGQNPKGEYSESDPLCVLDFYVTEEYQRSGIGLQLFQRLLEVRAIQSQDTRSRVPWMLPSPTCSTKPGD